MKLYCSDLPGPSGAYVACGDRLVPFDDEAAWALAQDGMLLSLDPAHAERLIVEGEKRAAERRPAPIAA